MQARVQGPLEIEKQKKKKKMVIRANIKLFHLYFATFLVENILFSAIFGAAPVNAREDAQRSKHGAFVGNTGLLKNNRQLQKIRKIK